MAARPRALPATHLLLAALLGLAAACGGGSHPDPFNRSDVPARYRPVADAVASALQREGAPGGAFAIIEGGTVTFAYGLGRKDPDRDERVRDTTLFRIGSVTKMMTALTVLQQVADGTVDLDRPVGAHVPGLHLDADPGAHLPALTVRELLDQTSGLNDYLETAAPPGERDGAALASFFTGRWAGLGYFMVPPGTFYNYSNPNYMLAGLVAEEAAGRPWAQLVRERAWLPLGMTRTLLEPADVLADGDFAIGATAAAPANGIPARIGPGAYDNGWARPAGYAWSSVHDLARFLTFLGAGDDAVLPPALHQAMVSPTHSTGELLDLVRYGFGLQALDGLWVDGAYRRVKVLTHDGAIAGFSSQVLLLPELGFGVITLVNADASAAHADAASAALRTLASLPAPETGPDVSVHPETFGDEVGTYVEPHLLGAITVSLVGGQLVVDAPGATAAGIPYDPVLIPVGPRNFLLSAAGDVLLVTFVHGGPADPVYLRTRHFVAVRAP